MVGQVSQLHLYNTLTRKKEVFYPINPQNVRMYVCGPTVYDYAHIGNARPIIVFDILFRLLRHLYGEKHVTYVRNITDIDDKINARAARDYPELQLNEAVRKVTEMTNAQFQRDVGALGCLQPTAQPRATEYIEAMKAMINRLVELGFAYVASDHVLFSIAAMNQAKELHYGVLSRRSLDDMLAGARVDVASYKRDEMDFVLWKPSKEDEPAWVSPAGIPVAGRPGWHIECSAMSMANLLEPWGGGLECHEAVKNIFDIHAGGMDLIFPHHENEIAQSCCALGTDRMANIWMHNGFLQIEGQKMSKSLGNFVTIHELLNGVGCRPRAGSVIRLAMLATHYRQPIDFTEEKLEYWYAKLCHWVELCDLQRGEDFLYNGHLSKSVSPSEEIIEALSDDLNFAPAFLFMDKLAQRAMKKDHKAANELGSNLLWLGLLAAGQAPLFQHIISRNDDVASFFGKYRDAIIDAKALAANRYGDFSINSVTERQKQIVDLEEEFVQRFPKTKEDGVRLRVSDHYTIVLEKIDGQLAQSFNIDEKLSQRLAFIREKNWLEADRIRSELAIQGIELKDSKDPVTEERMTTWEIKR